MPSALMPAAIKQRGMDVERPRWHLEIDPHTRYESFAKIADAKYKGAKLTENMHPTVRRALQLMKVGRRSDGMSAFCAKTLISVSAKAVPAANAQNHVQRQNNRLQEVAAIVASPPPQPPPIPQEEVLKVASSRSDNLHSMLAQQMDLHIQKSSAAAASHSTPFVDERWKELSAKEGAAGFAEFAEKQWDVMTEQHLGPAQKAELQHIRNMKSSLQQQIAALQSSYKAFEAAEIQMLLASNV